MFITSSFDNENSIHTRLVAVDVVARAVAKSINIEKYCRSSGQSILNKHAKENFGVKCRMSFE